MKPIPLFVIIVVSTLGVLLLTVGLVMGWSSWSDLSDAQRVEGIVVALVRAEKPKGQGPKKGQPVSKEPAFAPVVEYQVGGQTYRVRGHVASFPAAHAVHDIVVVAYPSDRPAEGRIDSFSENWLAPLVFGGGGAFFGLVGLGMLLARKRTGGG
jgi:hypothetical protein